MLLLLVWVGLLTCSLTVCPGKHVSVLSDTSFMLIWLGQAANGVKPCMKLWIGSRSQDRQKGDLNDVLAVFVIPLLSKSPNIMFYK